MSRAAMAIKMLDILKANSIVTKEELALRLHTNKRYITELRKEIELAGYKINVKLSDPAGYSLVKEKSVNDENKEYIKLVHDYIKCHNFFPKQEECLTSLESLMDVSNDDFNEIQLNQTNYRRKKFLKKNLNVLYECIRNNSKVNIQYLNDSGILIDVCYMPYNFLVEKDIWYCLGKAEIKSKIVDKKILIANIKKIDIKDDKFKKVSNIKKDFEPSVYYRVEIIIKNRWDLSNIQFGNSHILEKISDSEFKITFNSFDKEEVNRIIEGLNFYIVSYKVEEHYE